MLTEASRTANFTNELGVDHTVRYLKNIMGLWVLNEAVRTWHDQGMEIALPEADAAAAAAEPLRTVVDINDASFYSPGDMAARIDEAAHATGPRASRPCRGHGSGKRRHRRSRSRCDRRRSERPTAPDP